MSLMILTHHNQSHATHYNHYSYQRFHTSHDSLMIRCYNMYIWQNLPNYSHTSQGRIHDYSTGHSPFTRSQHIRHIHRNRLRLRGATRRYRSRVQAKALQSLTGKKTINEKDIASLKTLGITVQSQATQVATMVFA